MTFIYTNSSSIRRQSGRLCQVLRGRVSELEAELAEQSHLRLQAVGESEFLKAELDDLRRVREDTEKEQRSLTEIERKTCCRYVAALLCLKHLSWCSLNEVCSSIKTCECLWTHQYTSHFSPFIFLFVPQVVVSWLSWETRKKQEVRRLKTSSFLNTDSQWKETQRNLIAVTWETKKNLLKQAF